MALTEKEKARRATKRGHITRFVGKAKERAKAELLPFNIDADYLESIAPDECPVFKVKFTWGQSNGKNPYRPSLDRIVPELGYVKGNVAFISLKANIIKQDITENELYAVADWLHDERKKVLNAEQNKSTPVPTKRARKGQTDSPLGSLHGAGIGQDCDGSHHHRGEPEGQDTGCGTKESCRICMGSGVRQVEALKLYESCEDYGLTEAEVRGLKQLFGCVCH